jgi:hypothetical protein
VDQILWRKRPRKLVSYLLDIHLYIKGLVF